MTDRIASIHSAYRAKPSASVRPADATVHKASANGAPAGGWGTDAYAPTNPYYPSTPSYQTPTYQQPTYPQTPSYQYPSTPSYQTPSYQYPSTPSYQTPSYQYPSSPSAPPPPSRSGSSRICRAGCSSSRTG